MQLEDFKRNALKFKKFVDQYNELYESAIEEEIFKNAYPHIPIKDSYTLPFPAKKTESQLMEEFLLDKKPAI